MGNKAEVKILHFADLHLGVESYSCFDPQTGLSSRFSDILKALDRVVDYAVGEKVDLVLFCGDAYKSRNPSQTQQREFARRLKRISQEDIPVFLLVGNHDLPNAVGRATTVEIYDTLGVNNVYVANRPGIYHVATKSGGIQVVALPWPRRSALLSREEDKNLTIEEINDRLQQIMTQRLLDLSTKLDPALPSVLAAHVSVSTAKQGSERVMIIGRDPVLLPTNVALPSFDYVALGHIHKHQNLWEQPLMVYPGSLERLDFGDEGEKKGFCLVDVPPKGDNTGAQYEFHEIPARAFTTIKVNIDTPDDNPTFAVLEAIARRKSEIKDAIVRLQISLPQYLENSLKENEINQAVKEAQYVIFAKDVRSEARPRLGNWAAEGLTPLEALRAYLETK
ncbi:MAG: exonuclease SbcCD subunit D, partial [Dehalococcoidia bacterium]